jgi:hypothetical protein
MPGLRELGVTAVIAVRDSIRINGRYSLYIGASVASPQEHRYLEARESAK